jgi:beta-glucosidase/6-phospho-beta-glucosidase/beta-galactosidase
MPCTRFFTHHASYVYERTTGSAGNSTTEPYLCIHSSLLAHAAAVSIFRAQRRNNIGLIGMTVDTNWPEPWLVLFFSHVFESFYLVMQVSDCNHTQTENGGYSSRLCHENVLIPHIKYSIHNVFTPRTSTKNHRTDSAQDAAASDRSIQFSLGIFMGPCVFGDYPSIVKRRAGAVLPSFTPDQQRALKGSIDFLAINHYTSRYVRQPTGAEPAPGQGYREDKWTDTLTEDAHGNPIGPVADSSWLYVTPQFFAKLLQWIAKAYPGLDIYITENGVDVPNEGELPLQQALNDTFRVQYLHDYITAMSVALKEGVPLKGYFVWSLMDNFEWADGYSKRFGIHYVQYNVSGLPRWPKRSAKWFAALAASGSIPDPSKSISGSMPTWN